MNTLSDAFLLTDDNMVIRSGSQIMSHTSSRSNEIWDYFLYNGLSELFFDYGISVKESGSLCDVFQTKNGAAKPLGRSLSAEGVWGVRQ